jgi:hypothetical protein
LDRDWRCRPARVEPGVAALAAISRSPEGLAKILLGPRNRGCG